MADAWRLEVELRDHKLLADFMRLRGETVRTLAEKVSAVKVEGGKVKCSPATIGHLRSGYVKRTNPDRARAIAKVLNAPVDSLFMSTMSRVSQDAA